MNEAIHLDAFNLFCGKLIGEGIHRKVFECRVRPDLVVKVEHGEEYRSFANVRENLFWSNNAYNKRVADWLAPPEYLSPDGRIMLQKKTTPIDVNKLDELPQNIPSFLTDVKTDNFGWLNGRLVCHDYAFVIEQPARKLKAVKWRD